MDCYTRSLSPSKPQGRCSLPYRALAGPEGVRQHGVLIVGTAQRLLNSCSSFSWGRESRGRSRSAVRTAGEDGGLFEQHSGLR